MSLFHLDHFIKEEYDKNERRVPAWKIKWCKDNLQNMIGKDDDGVNRSDANISTQKTMSKKRMSLKKQKTGKKSKMQKSVETNLAAKAQKALNAAQEESEEDEDMAWKMRKNQQI